MSGAHGTRVTGRVDAAASVSPGIARAGGTNLSGQSDGVGTDSGALTVAWALTGTATTTAAQSNRQDGDRT
jgi:hypothetical protein